MNMIGALRKAGVRVGTGLFLGAGVAVLGTGVEAGVRVGAGVRDGVAILGEAGVVVETIADAD